VDQLSLSQQVYGSSCRGSGCAPLGVHVVLGEDAVVGLESAGLDVAFDVAGNLDVDRHGAVGTYRSLTHDRQPMKQATYPYRQLRGDTNADKRRQDA
jgi:hypothetical protein